MASGRVKQPKQLLRAFCLENALSLRKVNLKYPVPIIIFIIKNKIKAGQ